MLRSESSSAPPKTPDTVWRPFPKGHTIGHRFPPGVSGNPGGMTKEVAALRQEAIELAAKEAPAAVRRLASLMRGKGTVAKSACDSILDRASAGQLNIRT
jgi:hypothetical protein